MRQHMQWIAVVLTILSVGCGGGNASSPTSPSVVAPVASGAGNAVVAGNVRLGATAGVGSAADPMKVQVVGTDIVATVSLAGQFALDGVPSGQVVLHFFGAGVDATVSIGLVTTGETITISVTVVGSNAVVESETRTAANQQEEQIEGRIESLPPTQAADTFVVAGRLVTAVATTVFKMGSVTKTFADLEIGQRVHVKGTTADGVFTASQVEIQNVLTDLPANVNGIVSDLAGSELDFEFMVDGRKVRGDAETVFFGNGGLSDFTDLADGVRVEVKGQQQDAVIYAVRIHINGADDGTDDEDDDDDADDDGEAGPYSGAGPVASLGGACPAISFILKGARIDADAATVFDGVTCTALRNGDKVKVEGTRQSSGRVLATKIGT